MKEKINWRISISDGDGPFEYVILDGRDDVSCDEVAEMIHKFLQSREPMKRVVEKWVKN